MSFFDQMSMYPRRQQMGPYPGDTGVTSEVPQDGAAQAAAAPNAPPAAPPEPVISPVAGGPPPDTVFESELAPPEEKAKEPPSIAKFQGVAPVPKTAGEAETAMVVQAVQKEMAYRDQMDELSLYVTDDRAMADADEMIAADHEFGMATIGRAMARYKNQTEQLDRELEDYRTQDIEPNRIFGNMTGAGRFAAALNVAVGQMAATASGGPNGAMQLVESAINRDILAQQSNRQASLTALQEGRVLQANEWEQAKDVVLEREKMRALAFAHLRQRIMRKKGQVRTAKAARNLDAFEVLAKGKELEARFAARQASLSLIIESQLASGASAAKITKEIQKIVQVYNASMGIADRGNELSPDQLPGFMGENGAQGALPVEAPSSPVQPGQAESVPSAPASPTERGLQERRARRSVSAPEAGETAAHETGEAPSMETAEDTMPEEGTQPQPVSPNVAADELERIKAATPKLSAKERVSLAQGALPPNKDRVNVAKLGKDQSQVAAQKAREEWLAKHKAPILSKAELAEMTPLERFNYRRYKDLSDWIGKYPAVQERYFDNTGTTSGDMYRNAVRVDGMMQVLDPSSNGLLYLTQTSPLRNVPKSKRLTENDPSNELQKDIFDKQVAVRDAIDAASLIEEIGVPGRLSGLEFRLAPGKEGGIADLANISIKGLAEEESADAVMKIRQLRTKLVTMAAKFVKAFDQTSRLSDQDMRLAMETLGFSDSDTFMSGMLNAFKNGDSAMIKGYANFMRLFGENQLRDFRDKWRTKGVIFPPETESKARAELNKNIQEVADRGK